MENETQTNADALFEFESGLNQNGYPLTPIEKATQRAVRQLKEKQGAAFDDLKGAHAQIAMELAGNIAAGNRKGRAIANEAMQLTATLELLQPVTPETEEGRRDLPESVQLLVKAIAMRPAPGAPGASDL